MDVAKKLGAKTINRPPELATNEATVESAFVHAYEFIKSQIKKEIELIDTFFKKIAKKCHPDKTDNFPLQHPEIALEARVMVPQ